MPDDVPVIKPDSDDGKRGPVKTGDTNDKGLYTAMGAAALAALLASTTVLLRKKRKE